MMTKSLNGVWVLDLTNVLAGPYFSYRLALMGAEVIKVERPGEGDLARVWGMDPKRNAEGMGISFLATNASKKSIRLDMKSAVGKESPKSLVKTTDVLVENFRSRVMARLGQNLDILKEKNVNLIHCAISGFGQMGPRAGDPAYDQIIQGFARVMSITGSPDAQPYQFGYPNEDTSGGIAAAMLICAALNANPRGAFLDISMIDAMLSSMAWVVSNFLNGGLEPAPHGNENMTFAPSVTFLTADKPINIAANRDAQCISLATHIDRRDLLKRADYKTRLNAK